MGCHEGSGLEFNPNAPKAPLVPPNPGTGPVNFTGFLRPIFTPSPTPVSVPAPEPTPVPVPPITLIFPYGFCGSCHNPASPGYGGEPVIRFTFGFAVGVVTIYVMIRTRIGSAIGKGAGFYYLGRAIYEPEILIPRDEFEWGMLFGGVCGGAVKMIPAAVAEDRIILSSGRLLSNEKLDLGLKNVIIPPKEGYFDIVCHGNPNGYLLPEVWLLIRKISKK